MRALLAALLLALAAPAQGQQPQPPREVTVANETDRALHQIFLFRPGAAEPGPDRLGAHVLPPRAALRIPLGRTSACAFELLAVLEDGEEMRRRLDICRTSRILLAEPGPRREVEVANDSDLDLRELYVWARGTAEQGRDRLGASVVPAGESLRLRLHGLAGCLADLRAVFADGTEERRQGVDLCRAPRLGFGDPTLPVREVPVLNRARRAIHELYAAPPGQAHWGPDRLGAALLEPRASFRLRLRGQDCAFDLRAVYEDGQEEVQRGLDLCLVQGVVFGDQALPPRRLTLANEHRRQIRQAFLVPAGLRDWGQDALGGALAPGDRRDLTLEGGCHAGLRIVFDTGAAEERRGLDICAAPLLVLRPGWTVEEPPAAEGKAPPQAGIRLRNAAPLPVVELYADPAGAPRGPDRLGRTILGAGQSMAFAPPEDLPEASRCRADLLAVFRDGRELRLPGTDLCSGEEVVLR
ncbi:hypothetical protein [Crenalkalicoccus roseus]|uniref:hypothetical protein n=1 Tax=Crenalkalicoccus roseus TaxID=1485588 RepID=UPI00107FD61F|nr:hypothetical protein [Crenalkalicoccus roseus]